jgi:hypothetical protein
LISTACWSALAGGVEAATWGEEEEELLELEPEEEEDDWALWPAWVVPALPDEAGVLFAGVAAVLAPFRPWYR